MSSKVHQIVNETYKCKHQFDFIDNVVLWFNCNFSLATLVTHAKREMFSKSVIKTYYSFTSIEHSEALQGDSEIQYNPTFIL